MSDHVFFSLVPRLFFFATTKLPQRSLPLETHKYIFLTSDRLTYLPLPTFTFETSEKLLKLLKFSWLPFLNLKGQVFDAAAMNALSIVLAFDVPLGHLRLKATGLIPG